MFATCTALLLASHISLQAIEINFSGYPNGTPLEQNNPYAGILDLNATGFTRLLWRYSLADGGSSTSSYSTPIGVIRDGLVDIIAPSEVNSVSWGSDLVATFLTPVERVSFLLRKDFVYPLYVRYTGIDESGNAFSARNPGISEVDLLFHRITLDMGTGGAVITSFSFGAHDGANANNTYIQLGDISIEVPEAGGTLGLLGLAVLTMAVLRRSQSPGSGNMIAGRGHAVARCSYDQPRKPTHWVG